MVWVGAKKRRGGWTREKKLKAYDRVIFLSSHQSISFHTFSSPCACACAWTHTYTSSECQKSKVVIKFKNESDISELKTVLPKLLWLKWRYWSSDEEGYSPDSEARDPRGGYHENVLYRTICKRDYWSELIWQTGPVVGLWMHSCMQWGHISPVHPQCDWAQHRSAAGKTPPWAILTQRYFMLWHSQNTKILSSLPVQPSSRLFS